MIHHTKPVRILPNNKERDIVIVDYPYYIGHPGSGKTSNPDIISEYLKLVHRVKRNSKRVTSIKKIINSF